MAEGKTGQALAQRNAAYALLCNVFWPLAYKTRESEQVAVEPGYFLAGIETPRGPVCMTLPDSLWERLAVREDTAASIDGYSHVDLLERLPSLDAVRPVPTATMQLFGLLHGLLAALHDAFPTERARHHITLDPELKRLELGVWLDEADGGGVTFVLDEDLAEQGHVLIESIVAATRARLDEREEAADGRPDPA